MIESREGPGLKFQKFHQLRRCRSEPIGGGGNLPVIIVEGVERLREQSREEDVVGIDFDALLADARSPLDRGLRGLA